MRHEVLPDGGILFPDASISMPGGSIGLPDGSMMHVTRHRRGDTLEEVAAQLELVVLARTLDKA